MNPNFNQPGFLYNVPPPSASVQEPNQDDPALAIVQEMFQHQCSLILQEVEKRFTELRQEFLLKEKFATEIKSVRNDLSLEIQVSQGDILSNVHDLKIELQDEIKQLKAKLSEKFEAAKNKSISGNESDEDLLLIEDFSSKEAPGKSKAVVKPLSLGGQPDDDDLKLAELETQEFERSYGEKSTRETIQSSDDELSGPSTSTRGRKPGSKNRTKSKRQLEKELADIKKQYALKTLSLKKQEKK